MKTKWKCFKLLVSILFPLLISVIGMIWEYSMLLNIIMITIAVILVFIYIVLELAREKPTYKMFKWFYEFSSIAGKYKCKLSYLSYDYKSNSPIKNKIKFEGEKDIEVEFCYNDNKFFFLLRSNQSNSKGYLINHEKVDNGVRLVFIYNNKGSRDKNKGILPQHDGFMQIKLVDKKIEECTYSTLKPSRGSLSEWRKINKG